MLDKTDLEIGIVIGPLVVIRDAPKRLTAVRPIKTQLVCWPSNDGMPYAMDYKAIETGMVEVISESR